jgi:hypothetical protein
VTTSDPSILEVIATTGVVAALAALLVPAITSMLSAGSTRRAERRTRYAQMVANLAAWAELPYRIRRRSADDRQALDALTSRIHQLQEAVVLDRAELEADAPWLGRCHDVTFGAIRRGTVPFIIEAWESAPAATPQQLNLNGWGPKGLDRHVRDFQSQLCWRFGWRRSFGHIRSRLRKAERVTVTEEA